MYVFIGFGEPGCRLSLKGWEGGIHHLDEWYHHLDDWSNIWIDGTIT